MPRTGCRLPLRVSLVAALAASCPAIASGTGSPARFGARGDAELAFCAPMSPRCFRGAQANLFSGGEVVASASGGSKHLRITHTDVIVPAETQTLSCGPSLKEFSPSDETSGTSAPVISRKHLGPTADEIVAERRREALQRKSAVFNNWSTVAEESADSGVEAYARPMSAGFTNGGKRHLGPTLDEVVQLTRQQRPVSAPSGGSREGRHLGATMDDVVQMNRQRAPASSAPKKIGRVLTATGSFELVPGGPSREQVHALLNLGVADMPATKEEAAEMIRELRDMQMAKRLGMTGDSTIKTENRRTATAPAPPAKTPARTHMAVPGAPQDHLAHALSGVNMITRRSAP